jgi:hypothetical protein
MACVAPLNPTPVGRLLVTAAVLLVSASSVCGDERPAAALDESYTSDVWPIIERYCHDCHSGESAEAALNLAAFSTHADAAKSPERWQKVAEMVSNGLMPPPDADQPTTEERIRLQKWIRDFLSVEAQARAGDPGRVVLRRLSNAQYTYTLRDLTGVDSLAPAREFPVDGAAGEGFTNTGSALVMSPELVTKYLDAAKAVASHAVLLPDGFRFSPHTTARDWTDDILAQIRAFYAEFTVAGGENLTTQQGVPLDINLGGCLPLEKYFAATLVERRALESGDKSIAVVARQRGLSAKYLSLFWSGLTAKNPSLLLDGLRERWRAAKPGDEAALAREVVSWQKGLWRFASVGLIGRRDGPKRWLEPVSPLATEQAIKLKLPESADGKDFVISLVATDAGDGNENDYIVWRRPRLVAPGRPDLLLRDVRQAARNLAARRRQMLARVSDYLAAANEAIASPSSIDPAELARKHDIDEAALRAWFDYIGVGNDAPIVLSGLFTNQLTKTGGYEFINGWGTNEMPNMFANSSDQHVRIPGNMPPHSVAVHPSPTLRAVAAWRSPVTATVRIEAIVTPAHTECSNGVTWSLELRRGVTRQQFASGFAAGSQVGKAGPIEGVAVREGDIVSLGIGARDGIHSCDLTQVELKITPEETASEPKVWSLTGDVSGDVLSGNPHADHFGNGRVWFFLAEQDKPPEAERVVPAGSLLAKWQIASSKDERTQLALALETLLTSGPPADKASPDFILYRQMMSLGSPLVSGADNTNLTTEDLPTEISTAGLDPALFGKRPDGTPIDADSLCVRAPSVVEVRLPADLVAECELVATGVLDKKQGAEGSVQLRVVNGKATSIDGLRANEVAVVPLGGEWTGANQLIANSAPILVAPESSAQRRIEAAIEEYLALFPAALCYTKIVPVDEVVTLTLFHREDDHLQRLMLDEAQVAHLNRLWDELHFVSQDALRSVDAFEQILEYASQDADPKAFEPLREPIRERAAAFRNLLADSETKQLDALVEFAAQAYRRPLLEDEAINLRALYTSLRKQDIPHDESLRLTLARVFVSSAFLYRVERPTAETGQSPVTDWELASRLSYFLWSSQPDEELRTAAQSGRLRERDAIASQTRRMLGDAKSRRLATEFACQWLQIYDFDALDEKSEKHFPTFPTLRGPMYEESIRFFTDLFQNDGSVLNILDADYTFLNEELAKHYGIPGVAGAEWRRVDEMKKFSRGGILTQAATLARQSGASRTSPILRGTWITEVLLGDPLPKPPKGVPPLPDDEAATDGLTVRQLVEKHVSDPKCSVCHERIDPYGFALEAFDAIGRHRDKDLGDRPIDTRVTTKDGTKFEGLDGLRTYLLTKRRDAFVRQFCRKLLGYALGRGVQFSDEPLLDEMQSNLAANDYKIGTAIEMIVLSPQFREIRGRDAADSN